ncbi:hypothetical protein WJ94_25725 [Burkholderia ubonensis]|nr:hypothetical protein WJ94_25725 [Burkholderia ubonensis]
MSEDPQKVEAFRLDPEKYLTEAGVSEDVKQLLLAGRGVVAGPLRGRPRPRPIEGGGDTVVVVVVVVVVV